MPSLPASPAKRTEQADIPDSSGRVRQSPRPSEAVLARAQSSVLMDITILNASRNAAGTMEYLLATTASDGKMTCVKHRYSDFVALHAALQPILGKAMPLLPPSPTPLLRRATVNEQRQQKLLDWVRLVYASQLEPPP
eukprot:429719-Prymnesium_polylepis.1